MILRSPGSRNGDFHNIPPILVGNQLFAPEVQFPPFLAISTRKGPRPPIPAWPGLGSANSELFLLVQITAGRPRTKIHRKSFHAPTCTRVRTLGRLLSSKVFLDPVHVCRSAHWRGIGERAPECHPWVHHVEHDYSCSIGTGSARNQFRSSRDSHSA